MALPLGKMLAANHSRNSKKANPAFQGTRYSGLRPLPLAPELER